MCAGAMNREWRWVGEGGLMVPGEFVARQGVGEWALGGE